MKGPTISDKTIGENVRARRKLIGLSSQQFASLLGISNQQLNKYENGANRISAMQLAKISRILRIDVGHFLTPNALPFEKPINTSQRAADIANEPETTNLVKHYIAISDPRVRTAIVELVTSITKYFARSVHNG